jgi:hypothetical protein
MARGVSPRTRTRGTLLLAAAILDVKQPLPDGITPEFAASLGRLRPDEYQSDGDARLARAAVVAITTLADKYWPSE